jgi:hypothetical protein
MCDLGMPCGNENCPYIRAARERALAASIQRAREDEEFQARIEHSIKRHGDLMGRLEMSEFLVEERALTDEEMDEKWRDPFPHNDPGDETDA